MALNLYRRFLQGIGITPKASTENAVLGDIEVLSSDNKLHFHNNSINDAVVTEVVAATLTNKTINGPDNTITNLVNTNLSGSAGITNANLAAMTNNTVKGNTSGISAVPSDLALSNVTEATSSILTISNGSNVIVGASPLTIQVKQSGASQDGYLSSTDFNTFNAKQPAGNYITALTGDVSASGPGSSAATVNSVGGVSAANVASGATLANNATALSTVSTIVKRDASGKTALKGISLDGSTSGTVGILPAITTASYNITVPSSAPTSNSGFVFDGTNYVWQAISTAASGITASNTNHTLLTGTNVQAQLDQTDIGFNLLPSQLRFTSGSGTYNVSYYFVVTSANATAGAIYTNNGNNYTVQRTISGATLLLCSSNGVPTSSGTLTKSSGTGDTTITFSLAIAPVKIEIEAISGGGGGSGSGTASQGAASGGGNTTFGSVISITGGSPGLINTAFTGGGGIATVSSPAILLNSIEGSFGGGSPQINIANVTVLSGAGGSSFYTGAGAATFAGNTGNSARANTGSGGAGGGALATSGMFWGAGGQAGGWCKAEIYNPSSSYSFSIGTGGTGGTAGTSGQIGGAGAAGIIIVREYYV